MAVEVSNSKIQWPKICSLLKDQIISKRFFVSSISSKKRTNEFDFTTMIFVFVRFLEEIEDIKKPFRNYLTFNIGLN